MMEIKDIITLVVTVIVALIGVSSIAIYKYKKGNNRLKNINGNNVNVEQNIQSGNGNIQAGRDVDVKTKEWK